MVWTNSDGLRVPFHRELGTTTKAGEFATPANGDQHVAEISISDLTTLATGAAVMDHFVIIPAGARIEKVEIITTTAATSGGSAVLNVGLQRLDGSTEIDYDGLIAAAALATFNAVGETVSVTQGGTGAGALVGTTIGATYPGKVTADYDTAAFTAGAIKVKIYYSFLTAAQ